MVDLSNIKNIYLYLGNISFRGGINKLSNLIVTTFGNNNLTNSYFIFFSKDKTQMKIVEFEEDRIWLYHNKLKGMKYLLPTVDEGKIIIDKEQLLIILKNVKKSREKA